MIVSTNKSNESKYVDHQILLENENLFEFITSSISLSYLSISFFICI